MWSTKDDRGLHAMSAVSGHFIFNLLYCGVFWFSLIIVRMPIYKSDLYLFASSGLRLDTSHVRVGTQSMRVRFLDERTTEQIACGHSTHLCRRVWMNDELVNLINDRCRVPFDLRPFWPKRETKAAITWKDNWPGNVTAAGGMITKRNKNKKSNTEAVTY